MKGAIIRRVSKGPKTAGTVELPPRSGSSGYTVGDIIEYAVEMGVPLQTVLGCALMFDSGAVSAYDVVIDLDRRIINIDG